MKRRQATTIEKSPELQMIEGLCTAHGKSLYLRVQHPLRNDWMMLYSAINDLQTTYHWDIYRINEWMKFAREW